MTHPIFFASALTSSVADIAVLTGATLRPDADGTRAIGKVAALDEAGANAVTYVEDAMLASLGATRAGACFVTEAHAERLPAGTIALIVLKPALAFSQVVATFYPTASRPLSIFATQGISPAAFIHPDARLESDVTIDPGVVVGPRVEIGSGTTIGANSVIGFDVRIGRDCAIGAQVTIANALIGNRVVIHPGVRIGQDSGDDRSGQLSSVRIPGLGRVIIQDEADIGANSTIDRGGLRDTVVGEGSRIGNLIHIARDRTIPRHAVLRS